MTILKQGACKFCEVCDSIKTCKEPCGELIRLNTVLEDHMLNPPVRKPYYQLKPYKFQKLQ